MSGEASGADGETNDPERPVVCDFCGRPAESVRRVALDREYERLVTPHRVRFACPECSERKERERRGR